LGILPLNCYTRRDFSGRSEKKRNNLLVKANQSLNRKEKKNVVENYIKTEKNRQYQQLWLKTPQQQQTKRIEDMYKHSFI
jgi:hypothetical protein